MLTLRTQTITFPLIQQWHENSSKITSSQVLSPGISPEVAIALIHHVPCHGRGGIDSNISNTLGRNQALERSVPVRNIRGRPKQSMDADWLQINSRGPH
ncbi:hypothetical protein AVEN_86147-1 [Araneus ventricosus]|uniref:Uncharacterized protein n=1 Tax=Araneus ventricosus TaxID=182803 RepID=A0A4Y2KZU9_ARAVE|nr:hypothetical protein AVEN_86147-1 [Araneus ventricosus]